MRRPTLLLMATMALALLLGSGLALLSASKPAQAATPLYPDLKTLKPFDLRFGTATINGTTHKVLRFSNTAWNAGQGRLELRASTVSTASGKKSRVNQRIYDNAGGYTDKYVGDMVFHEAHNHFHFENFANYQLWTRADYDNWLASGMARGQAIKRGTKTTFCLMDTYRVQALPGSPTSAYYTQCGNTLQGISVGWGDTYGYNLPDQWIDLGTSSYLSDGDYVLRSVADPKNVLYESANKGDTSRESQQANAGVTFFRVSGGTITNSVDTGGDTVKPRVKRVVPAENATGIAPRANVSAFFSEAMRGSSINKNTVKLFKAGTTTRVGATVTYDAANKKAILNPNRNLKRGAKYKAVVTTKAMDRAGNRLDQKPRVRGNQPKVWFFTVRN